MYKKIISLCVIILIGAGVLMIPVQSGILLTNNEGEYYHFFSWKSDQVTIGWKHSVELTPWEETYHIEDNGELSFVSTKYKSYGAGTPDTDGNVEFLEDGFIRVTGIIRSIPNYSLFYVPISKYFIKNDSNIYPLSEFVPDYTNVQIQPKRIRLYQWLWLELTDKIGRE